MINLVIDIGNHRTKLAWFADGRMKRKSITRSGDLAVIKSKIASLPKRSSILVSSVMGYPAGLKNLFNKNHRLIFMSHKLPLPVILHYQTPQSLGHDRIANAAGAQFLFPGKNVLIIDSGTCLKMDFLKSGSLFMGGTIAPGLTMRYRALHEFTAALPRLQPVENFPDSGNDTKSCIHAGVQQGMTDEMNHAIERYRKKHPGIKVLLAGGDAPFFVNHLKNPIFAAPDLTLIGLNQILEHNAAIPF